MIDNMAIKITDQLIDNGIVKEKEKDIYIYGLQLLFFNVIELITVMILALLLDIFMESLIFLIFFAVLRTFAGGYHADTYLKCFCMTTSIVFIPIFILKNIVLHDYIYYATLFCITTILLILYSPTDSPNKRLIDKERTRYRRISFLLFIVFNVFIIIGYLMGFNDYSNIATTAIFLASLSLLPIINK